MQGTHNFPNPNKVNVLKKVNLQHKDKVNTNFKVQLNKIQLEVF